MLDASSNTGYLDIEMGLSGSPMVAVHRMFADPKELAICIENFVVVEVLSRLEKSGIRMLIGYSRVLDKAMPVPAPNHCRITCGIWRMIDFRVVLFCRELEDHRRTFDERRTFDKLR